MPPEKVEIVRGIYAEWSRGNLAAGAELYDPDLVFLAPRDNLEETRYVGLEEVRGWMRRWLDAWSDFTMTADELIEAGDSVVVAVRQRGVGKESGLASERSFFQIWTFRGARVIRLEQIDDRREAMAAVGLECE